MRPPADPSFGAVRSAGLGAIAIGAVAAMAMMLRAGGPNRPAVLVPLFAVWDVSPYVLLWFLYRLSRTWARTPRIALYGAMIAVTVGSIGFYVYDALYPRAAQPAFAYVIVPPVCWLFVAAVLGVAGYISYQRRESGANV